jgi:hypothetical protein
LAQRINAVVQGWVTYYGRYFPSVLDPVLTRINVELPRFSREFTTWSSIGASELAFLLSWGPWGVDMWTARW